MNKIWVGCFLTSLYLPSVMAQAPLSLEERLAQMEQRLKGDGGARRQRRGGN
ncbi:glycoporin [Klebsiella pneumoniae]|uniref:Glycoporin n=1 Tax=Klebsiella pneumoniae TaxID=573 RepID=A0A3S4GDT4_KLEPN|nr:glycoporin [Klebsiella pneumoniae]